MPWVKLDDHFDENPKLAKAGPLGLALWVTGLAYCNRTMTDGYIPRRIAHRLLCFEGIGIINGMVGEDATCERIALDLIDAGLWELDDEGYRVHDYLEFQPSKADAQAAKAVKVQAGRAGGQASAQARATASAQPPAQARATAPPQAKSNPVPGPGPGPGTGTGTRIPIPGPDTKKMSEAEPPTPPLTQPAQRFSEDSTEIALARHLQERILDNDPKTRTPASLQGWAKDIDLLIRVDGRAPNEVRATIDWATSDPFWRTNVLSAFSLRKHYTRLSLQSRTPKSIVNNGPHDPTMTQENRDGLDRYFRETAIPVSTDEYWPGNGTPKVPAL